MATPSYPSRFTQLVNLLKHEYDRVSIESQPCKRLRTEFSRRAEEQASKFTAMLSEVHHLEGNHQLVKEKYQTEILRLQGPVPPPLQPVRQNATALPLTQNILPARAPSLDQAPNPAFDPPAPHSAFIPMPDSTQRTPSASADDCTVYQSRAANSSLANMQKSLQHTLHLHSPVCCVRYSWDGQYLATGSTRAAYIFDGTSGQCVATFSNDTGTPADDGRCSDGYVRAVCFSPDGDSLITGAEDHVVKVWDLRNRKVRRRLVGHSSNIYSVDVSANSQFIISGSGDKKVKLWSLETGKLLSTLDGEFGPSGAITSVSVSPTCQHVAAGSLDKVIRVWDVESTRLVRQLEGHRDCVYSVAFSPDGRMVLSGSRDKTLRLWDLTASHPSRQCSPSFDGHEDCVLSVAFNPNGRWLISGSQDRTVQFWDPRQATVRLMLQDYESSVISIAHNPASKSLATGLEDFSDAHTWLYSL